MQADRIGPLRMSLDDGRLVAATIATAEQLIGRGAWDEAVSHLQAAVDRRPDLVALQQELDLVKKERERLKSQAAHRRHVAELVHEAGRLLSLNDPAAAVKVADRVLAMVPQHEEASRLRTEALARLEQQAQKAIAAARARNHVSRALRHLAAGRFDKAVAEATTAVGIAPDVARPETVRKEAQRLLDAGAGVKQKTIAARAREREVIRLLGSARTLLASGDGANALRDVEQAVALDPSHEEGKHLLDHVRSYLELVSADTDDTASLAPVEPVRSSGLARVLDQVAEVVADVGRRLSERLRSRRS
jgi:tetratricopeptide (TPR) repeat protein